MGQLSSEVAKKIDGKSWDEVREKFLELCGVILDVSPRATGTLTTVYVKFTPDSSPDAPVYAVAWLKNSRKWIIGLALPDGVHAPEFVVPPKRYAGLTKYFYITPDDPIPPLLSKWAAQAHENIANTGDL